MTAETDRYEFMTDKEAISFIKLMTDELLGIAQRRGFRQLTSALTSVELKAKTMSIPRQEAG